MCIRDRSTAYQAGLSASWEIDLWGRIRRQSEAALANLLATNEARRGVVLSLVASVANSYLQLRGLDAQLAVAQKTLSTYGESVKLFTLQYTVSYTHLDVYKRQAWSGLAFEERKSGGTSALAFVFGLVIVFLVLAAQYESWTLPGAVMTAVPFGILGALLTNWARGLENDVYFQIGLLVLIGLGAKNAVLRVSAAVDFRQQGKSIMEATVLAGEQLSLIHI